MSSANRSIEVCILLIILFIYIRKIEPCGTPAKTLFQSGTIPLTTTLRPERAKKRFRAANSRQCDQALISDSDERYVTENLSDLFLYLAILW